MFGNTTSVRLCNCNEHFCAIHGNISHLFRSIDDIAQWRLYVFQYGYPAGYGVAALCLVQIFCICELGDQVDVIIVCLDFIMFELFFKISSFPPFHEIKTRIMDYQIHSTIPNGTFYQSEFRRT